MVWYGFHCKECRWADEDWLQMFKSQLYDPKLQTQFSTPSAGFQDLTHTNICKGKVSLIFM